MPRPRVPAVLAVGLLFASIRPAISGPDDQGAGPVGLSDLIAFGLKNDPALVAKRGKIGIAEAQERAAHDWPDPQLRFRRTWGFNEVPPPFTERREESFTDHVTRTQVNKDGEVEKVRSVEQVNRVTEQHVTPGRDGTTTQETVREHSRESSDIAANPDIFQPAGKELDTQSSYRSGTQTDFHEYDPFAPEDGFVAQLRLYVPHPKRRRAQIESARREVELAKAQARAEEREVVLEIREMYEELQFLQTELRLLERGDSTADDYEKTQEKLFKAGEITRDKIEFVDRNPFEARLARAEFEGMRDKLAARVGLRDGSRIRVTDRLISAALSLDHTHLEYLIQMAFANRAELVEVLGRGRIAESELDEAKANNLPWFDYFQFGAGRSEQGGIQTDTEWSVQFAMTLPIFTWFGNEKDIYEAAITSLYAQKEANQGIITGEVAAAYKNVQRASKLRADARANAVDQKQRNDDFLAKFEGMGELQYAETRYDMSRATNKGDLQRLKAERTYNVALIELEDAIGAPLDRIFDGGEATEVEITESAEPAEPTPKKPDAKPPSTETPNDPEAGEAAPEGEKPRWFPRLSPPKNGSKQRGFGKRRR